MGVLDGGIIAGPHVRNASRRHLADLKVGGERGLRWDLDEALKSLRFFPGLLRLTGGDFEGLPFDLHLSQKFIVGSIFGWKRADGFRRFRRAYVEMGKGNGKSPLAAGIGIKMMLADGEARAEVYAAASKKDQAMVLFRDAVAMRQLSTRLSARLLESGKNPVWQLTDLTTGSFFKPLSNEDSQSGPRPSCGLCDEVHEMKDRVVLSMIERGFKHRNQPLLLMITNSGFDRNSVCYERHQHAVKVAAGTATPDDVFTFVGEPIDDMTFSYVCALDKGEDPLEDTACHPKANPLYAVTVKESNLAEEVRQAKLLPGIRNDVLRLRFCVWTDSATSWMSRQALEEVLADFDPEVEHAGAELNGGLDLSSNQDMTGAGFVVETGTKQVERVGKDGTVTTLELPTYDAWVEAWTPADTLRERADRDRAPYEAWVQQGHLNAVPGKLVRHDYVAARLSELSEAFLWKWLAYDQYTFRQFRDRLDEAGLQVRTIWHPQAGQRRSKPPDEELEEAKLQGLKPDDPAYPQGLWMPGSLRELEKLILEKRIRLRRSPVLISACMSAAIEEDKLMGNRWVSKSKATNRIDVLVALLMAVGAATRNPPLNAGPSVYENENVFV